jgi:hypothetical protein
VASEYDFQGPGVDKPHPRKNWVNPDAKQVHFASNESPKAARGGGTEKSGRGILRFFRRRSG